MSLETACERREINLDLFEDLYLKAMATIWPCLSFMCHIRSTMVVGEVCLKILLLALSFLSGSLHSRFVPGKATEQWREGARERERGSERDGERGREGEREREREGESARARARETERASEREKEREWREGVAWSSFSLLSLFTIRVSLFSFTVFICPQSSRSCKLTDSCPKVGGSAP